MNEKEKTRREQWDTEHPNVNKDTGEIKEEKI